MIKVKSGTIYAFSEQLQHSFPRATHVFMSAWKEFFHFYHEWRCILLVLIFLFYI